MGKAFKTLWANHSAAELASSLWIMTWIAIIYQVTGSAALAGGISLVRSLAILLSGLTLPMWYRRWSLEQVLHRFQVVNISTSLLFIFLMYQTDISNSTSTIVVLAYISNLISGYTKGCANAATTALYPRLVEQEQWAKSNSVINIAQQFVAMFGWTIGGILIQYLGGTNVLLLSAGILTAAGLILFFIQFPSSETGTAKSKSMWSGWGILFRDTRIRIVTVMDIIEGLASGIWIGGITLLFVEEVLYKSEAWWGYINASYYAGSIFGAYLIMRLSKQLQNHLLPSLLLGSFTFCLFLFAYASTSSAWWALLLVFAMGPSSQMRDVAQRTYVQLSVDLDQQPNLFAAQSAMQTLLLGISITATGVVADLWGARSVYLVAGFMFLLSSILGVILLRYQNSSSLHTKTM